MKKLAFALIVALALLPAAASADVRRGDRGEEVRYLQWLLFENGWLFEEPDGIFGGHTEQAVKDYQRAKGFEPTGEANYWLMEQIDHDRVSLDQENFGPDYYMPYDGDFTPPFPSGPESGYDPDIGGYVPPAVCQTTILRDMAMRDSCDRHLPLLEREYALTQSAEAAGWAEASELWLEEIRAQFGEWLQAAPAEQKLDVLAAATAWNAAFGEQRAALYAVWNDPFIAERELTLMARFFSGTLCELLRGEFPFDPDLGYFEAFQPDPAAFCGFRSEVVGTEYADACDEHAALLNREYEWFWDGADDAQALEALAGEWDQAMAALYDQWLALCDEAQGEAVLNARANVFKAITRLEIALQGEDGERGARLRVSQGETMRLCELLNYLTAAN